MYQKVTPTDETEVFFASLQPGQVFTELFDAVPGAHFFIKDSRSRFMAASRSFVRLMGVERVEDLLGRTDYDFSADFLAEGFLADDREVLRSGQPMLGKLEMVPSGATLEWLTTTKVPLLSRGGAVVGLAGVTQVTNRGDSLYRDHPGMHEIIEHVRANFRRRLAVADLARVAGISVSTVERRFRETFGLSPNKYLRRMRLNAACHALRTTDRPLADIARELGFPGQASMTRDFRLELRLTPARFRARFRIQLGMLPAAA
jgi:AraC-like DNA-binding protein